MKNLEYEQLCVVGDIHGEFRELVWLIHNKYHIKGTAFIVVGDFGLGFHKKGYYETVVWNRIKKDLENDGNCILGLRGNHDNPDFYDPTSENFIDFPRFKALQDYERLEWKDREILTIGGAVSRDVVEREEGKDWWEGEDIQRDWSKIKEKEDIILSHDAPICFGPVPVKHEKIPTDVFQKMLDSRNFLYQVLKQTNPRRWFFGHYHESTSGDWGDTLWRGLSINEIIEIRDELYKI